MQPTTLVRLLLLCLSLLSSSAFAKVITFDFASLVGRYDVGFSGRLADGTDISGTALQASYQHLQWTVDGVTITTRAEYLAEEYDDYWNPLEPVPSALYLQSHFAGVGKCTNPLSDNDCQGNTALSTRIGYSDYLYFNFSEVVNITTIRFSLGFDETGIDPGNYEARAYSGRVDISGGPEGRLGSDKGLGDAWRGAWWGDELAYYKNEGLPAFIEYITVETADVPEPPVFLLLIAGFALAAYRQRCFT